MAQLVVRNLEDQLKVRLQRLARKHGRSMEEEVRDILRNAVREQPSPSGLGTDIALLFKGIGIEQDIPERRGNQVVPVTFKE